MTLLWTAGLIISFSILDHIDGLCASVSVVAAVPFFAEGTLAGASPGSGMLVSATAGAASVLLPWNFRPAKTFLGDGGAHLMGFMAAAVSLQFTRRPTLRWLSLWWVSLLLKWGSVHGEREGTASGETRAELGNEAGLSVMSHPERSRA